MISGKVAFNECAALASIGVVVLPDDQGMNMSESWTATVQELVKTCLGKHWGLDVDGGRIWNMASMKI